MNMRYAEEPPIPNHIYCLYEVFAMAIFHNMKRSRKRLQGME